MSLEIELAAYKRELPKLLQEDVGRYALVYGDKVDSCWDTFRDAIQEGYRLFGLAPFMVKQVQAVEPVYYLRRPAVSAANDAGS